MPDLEAPGAPAVREALDPLVAVEGLGRGPEPPVRVVVEHAAQPAAPGEIRAPEVLRRLPLTDDVATVQREVEALAGRDLDGGPNRVPRIRVPPHHTVLVAPADRGRVAEQIRPAADRDVVPLGESVDEELRLAELVGCPAAAFLVDLRQVRVDQLVHAVTGWACAERGIGDPPPRDHVVGQIHRPGLGGEVEDRRAYLSPLRDDLNHPVRGLGSIESRRGGTLDHLDALDIGRVDVIQPGSRGVALHEAAVADHAHPIDIDDGIARNPDAGVAADPDLGTVAGAVRLSEEHHARDPARQNVLDRLDRRLDGQVGHADPLDQVPDGPHL